MKRIFDKDRSIYIHLCLSALLLLQQGCFSLDVDPPSVLVVTVLSSMP